MLTLKCLGVDAGDLRNLLSYGKLQLKPTKTPGRTSNSHPFTYKTISFPTKPSVFPPVFLVLPLGIASLLFASPLPPRMWGPLSSPRRPREEPWSWRWRSGGIFREAACGMRKRTTDIHQKPPNTSKKTAKTSKNQQKTGKNRKNNKKQQTTFFLFLFLSVLLFKGVVFELPSRDSKELYALGAIDSEVPWMDLLDKRNG